MKFASPDIAGGQPFEVARKLFCSADIDKIARQLADGRPIFKNGDGRKTFCPLCRSQSKRRRSRRTLSITARQGHILVHCHRCKSQGVEIVRALVSLGLLPNLFRERAAVRTLAESVRAAINDTAWTGTSKATDLSVLEVLLKIATRTRKAELGASAREVADRAQVRCSTAWRSLRRLTMDGWLESVHPAHGPRPAIWRLRTPKNLRDRSETIVHALKEGDRVFHRDPDFTGDRVERVHPVVSFPHEVFRWGKGLGLTKGRIYSALGAPRTASKIAETLEYKCVRNVRLHLRVLCERGLARKRSDGLYERCDDRLGPVAVQLGVSGANERQRIRHAAERASFQGWCEALEHWKRSGQVVDPETGVELASWVRPPQRVTLASFRRVVLSARMSTAEEALGNSVSQQGERRDSHRPTIERPFGIDQ
jgi:hypothetical protein